MLVTVLVITHGAFLYKFRNTFFADFFTPSTSSATRIASSTAFIAFLTSPPQP